MKRFSAQYIFTNTGPALIRGILTTDDDGTIISIDDTGGNLEETRSVSFHNGIIIPGFVNCHCHLELSHMKGQIPPGSGLAQFILQIRNLRGAETRDIETAFRKADSEMAAEGIVLCADICNSPATFSFKTGSSVRYLNLIEVFGIDPEKAIKRIGEAESIARIAESNGLQWAIVPHSVYSLSLLLLDLVKELTAKNRVTSVHYMESKAEMQFINGHSGPIPQSYRDSGLLEGDPVTVKSHSSAVLDAMTSSGTLILVHCTFAGEGDVKEVSARKDLFWCLCPGSNIYIENQLPPVGMLREQGCRIVIGTDSLASNNKLSILEEIRILQENFPGVSLEELVMWATRNGAIALGMDDTCGSFSPGLKPGVLLLEDLDLLNMKILPGTRVKRLV
jgi:aminodeoxyfutalosine deaminase